MTSCFGAGSPPSPKDYTIRWNQSTLEKVSGDGDHYAGYARCRELADGSLGFAYEAGGNIFFRVRTGKGWQEPILVAAAAPEVGMAVPDFTVLGNGDVLLGYNPRPRRNAKDKHFGIRTVRSTDNGTTWQDDQLVYEAGTSFGDGCWEPVFLQLPDGDIQLYFADEGIFTHSNEQRIAMVSSTDSGTTWSKIPKTVSFRKGARDGMPVPVWLEKEERIAVAIEDNGHGPFKPYILFNDGTEWDEEIAGNSSARSYAMADSLPEKDYAGAPYLAKASNGLTFLSFQWGDRLEDAQMAVAIGDEGAQNFTNVTWPFDLAKGKTGHWNSLTVLEDGRIVALTSTNGYSETDQTEVWMIMGEMVKK
ncbi:sialidase family protein [Echinicola soli]|nr:sialidase family protein [Echinicola soli]